MKSKGFTLMELLAVVICLGLLAVIAAPKYLDLKKDAELTIMETMEAAIKSAAEMSSMKIFLKPSNLNSNQNIYTQPSSQTIRVRGKIPDGRWNNTFAHLVNFESIAQYTNASPCTDEKVKWCVRQRGSGWFFNRDYITENIGRGFIIYPFGNNANQERCYIYYINLNDEPIPEIVNPFVTGVDFSDC